MGIEKQHLKHSNGLGKRVMEIKDSPKELLENRKNADALISKWMRPVYGLDSKASSSEGMLFHRSSTAPRGPSALDLRAEQGAQHAENRPVFLKVRTPIASKLDYVHKPQSDQHAALLAKKAELKKSAPKRTDEVERKPINDAVRAKPAAF